MIGRALTEALRARGDEVRVVTRRPAGPDDVQWEPLKGVLQPAKLEGCDVVFNLTGAPMATRPWTRARRQVLQESRIQATEALMASLETLDRPPATFIGVSNLGLFGDRGDDVLDDEAPPGSGFLADLCVAWEHAHQAAEDLGCRVAVLRMAVVLAPDDGAFPLMVRPFRYVGGWLGNGQQYTPWLSIRDAVGALLFLADTEAIVGPVNGTVPDPTRNKAWLQALGRVMHKPVVTHAPKWALRGAFGELADEIFLASVRAVPRKLLEHGYRFVDAEAEGAFRWLHTEYTRMEAAGLLREP